MHFKTLFSIKKPPMLPVFAVLYSLPSFHSVVLPYVCQSASTDPQKQDVDSVLGLHTVEAERFTIKAFWVLAFDPSPDRTIHRLVSYKPLESMQVFFQ